MFLHPAQADLVSTVLSGPDPGSGSGWAGKRRSWAVHRACASGGGRNTKQHGAVDYVSKALGNALTPGVGQSLLPATPASRTDHSQANSWRLGYDGYFREGLANPSFGVPRLD